MPESNTEQRKLAAIMFTDMVGYSALAQRNEALALELLEEHRRAVREVIPRHGGREVKTTGDGFLIEFPSALAAVQAAVEIQRTMHERNQVSPTERQINIRIGLHVGDVVMNEGDIHGDGVNIAARLEPLAPPGGICISSAVWEQVRNKVPHPMAEVGPAELKNIQLPVVVHRVVMPWENPQTTRARPKRTGMAVAAIVVVCILVGIAAWRHLRPAPAPATSAAAGTNIPLPVAPRPDTNGILFASGFEAPNYTLGVLDRQKGWNARGGSSIKAGQVITSAAGQLLSISGADMEQVASNLYSARFGHPLPTGNEADSAKKLSITADLRFNPGVTGREAGFLAAMLMLEDEQIVPFVSMGITRQGRAFGQNFARPNQAVYGNVAIDTIHHLRAELDLEARQASFFLDGERFGSLAFNPQSGKQAAYFSVALQSDRPVDSVLLLDNVVVRRLDPAPENK